MLRSRFCYLVTYKDRKFFVDGDSLANKRFLIYTSMPFKYEPPHDNEIIPKEDVDYVLKELTLYLEKKGLIVERG